MVMIDNCQRNIIPMLKILANLIKIKKYKIISFFSPSNFRVKYDFFFFFQCFNVKKSEVWPDVRIFGHQGGHLQVKQRRIGQFEDLSDRTDGITQPVWVLSLSTHKYASKQAL